MSKHLATMGKKKLPLNRKKALAESDSGRGGFNSSTIERFFHFMFTLLGPYWTHILFTWTKKDGLKVYINATLTAENKNGSISEETYGDPYPDLVIGTANNKGYSHYVTGAFDEFVIWERALSPENISLYYNATIGRTCLLLKKTLLTFLKMLIY